MAKLVLEVETNGLEAFNRVNQGMNDLNNGVDKFEKNSKEAFVAVSKETDNLNQKIKTTASESVNASNKILEGANKEKAAIALLKQQIAEVIKYEKELQAQREKMAPGKGQLEYNKKIAEVRLDLKGMQKDLLDLEATEKKLLPPVESLKKQLKDLKAQIADTTDPDDYQRLVNKAGELEDKIGDTSAAVKAFASDSKAAQAKNLFEQIGNDIRNLDFKDASEKAKQFATVIQTVSFKEMIGGAKYFASTIISVGKTLLTNPLFLFAAVLVSVGLAFKGLYDSINAGDQALKDNKEALQGITDATNDLIKANRDLALENDINAKKIPTADGERLKNQNKFKDAYLKLLAEQRAAEKKFNDDIAAEREDDGFKGTKALYEKFGGETDLTKKQKQGLKDIEITFGKQLEEIRKQFQLEDAKARIEANIEAEKKAKEAGDKRKKDAEQAAKDLATALLNIAKESEAAFTDLLSGRERLDAQLNTANASVEILKQELLKKKVLAGKAGELTLSEQAMFDTLMLKNAQAHADGLIAIEVENANLLIGQEEKKTKNALELFNLRQQTLINAANITKRPNGVSEADFELQKQRAVLNIQKAGLEESLKLQIDEINKVAAVQIEGKNGELLLIKGKTDQISNVKRIGLEADIAMIKAKTPEEIEAIKTKMAAELAVINKALIDNNNAVKKSPPIDWSKILGVSEEDARLIIQGVNEIMARSQQLVDQQFASQQKLLDGELSVIQKRKDARNNELSELQEQLNTELGFRKQGLANNVDSVRKEIEAKEAARQKDIEAEKKIQDQKKKLAKQQLIVDTALQSSQMITAVATTINTYAAVPYIAAALVALQIGTFIAAKAQAFKAINQQSSAGFKKGGYTGDASVDTVVGEVHGQEFVNKADDTKKYRSLFEGIHTKDKKMMEIGVRDLINGTGVTLSKETPKELSQMKSEARSQEINVMLPKKDIDNDKRMESIEVNIKKLVKQGSENEFVDENGNRIIKKGSLTRVIKKR